MASPSGAARSREARLQLRLLLGLADGQLLSAATVILAAVSAQATFPYFPGVGSLLAVSVVHASLTAGGWKHEAAWMTLNIGILMMARNLVVAMAQPAEVVMLQVNVSDWVLLHLALGWFCIGMFMGAQPLPLVVRFIYGLMCIIIRTTRTVSAWLKTDSPLPLTVMMPATVCPFILGFFGAIFCRHLASSCASLLEAYDAAIENERLIDPGIRSSSNAHRVEAVRAVSRISPPAADTPLSETPLSLSVSESTDSGSMSSSSGRRLRFKQHPDAGTLAATRAPAGEHACRLDAIIQQTMRDARAASDAKPADDADGQAWCVGTGNPLTPVVTSVALQPRQPLLVEAPLPAAHLPELRFDAESNRLSSAFDAATLPPTLARARIHPDSLQPSTVLGSGAFGLVFDGSWRRHPSTEASSTFDGSMEGHPNPADDDASSSPTPLRVAIKQIHRHRLEADQLNDMKRAAIIELELTPHPNILRLYVRRVGGVSRRAPLPALSVAALGSSRRAPPHACMAALVKPSSRSDRHSPPRSRDRALSAGLVGGSEKRDVAFGHGAVRWRIARVAAGGASLAHVERAPDATGLVADWAGDGLPARAGAADCAPRPQAGEYTLCWRRRQARRFWREPSGRCHMDVCNGRHAAICRTGAAHLPVLHGLGGRVVVRLCPRMHRTPSDHAVWDTRTADRRLARSSGEWQLAPHRGCRPSAACPRPRLL